LGVSLQRARVETAAALTAASQIADSDLQGARTVLGQRPLEQVTSLM